MVDAIRRFNRIIGPAGCHVDAVGNWPGTRSNSASGAFFRHSAMHGYHNRPLQLSNHSLGHPLLIFRQHRCYDVTRSDLAPGEKKLAAGAVGDVAGGKAVGQVLTPPNLACYRFSLSFSSSLSPSHLIEA
jgi:hypothetical protein